MGFPEASGAWLWQSWVSVCGALEDHVKWDFCFACLFFFHPCLYFAVLLPEEFSQGSPHIT